MQTSTREPAALEVLALTKRYGSVLAANEISFKARRGSITALLGPNGAGKSTTISCATGLLTPDEGNVFLLGHSPTRMNADQRAKIGVMLQDGGLTPSAKPKELLDYASRMFVDPRSTTELSRLLDIDSFASTMVRRLSGGQRQRLSLALALIGKPDVLFLDEPTAGMDAGIRRRTRDLIRSEAKRGCAIILTTHAIDDVMELADHAVVIARGRVIADGSPDEVASLLGSNSCASSLDVRANSPENLRVFLSDASALAARHGINLREVSNARTLEDALAGLSLECYEEQ